MDSTTERQSAYTVMVSVSGDDAEADNLSAALLAAATLVDDHVRSTGTGFRQTRDSVYVLHDGQYDGVATMLARQGRREPLSAEWSR